MAVGNVLRQGIIYFPSRRKLLCPPLSLERSILMYPFQNLTSTSVQLLAAAYYLYNLES